MVSLEAICTKCSKKIPKIAIKKSKVSKKEFVPEQNRNHRQRRRYGNAEREMKRYKQENNVMCENCYKASNEGYVITIDHIIPISKGGTRTKDNLQFLCDKCNFEKADKIIPPSP